MWHRARLLAALTYRLPAGTWGQVWHVWAGVSRSTTSPWIEFLIKKVAPAPAPTLLYYTGNPVDLSEGNPRIQVVARFAVALQPRVRCSGYRDTRPVAGTDTPSQHSAWPPAPGYTNAIDLSIYRGDKPDLGIDTESLDLLVQGLLRAIRHGKLKDVSRLIYKDKQYRLDHDFQPAPYTGVYHGSHTHIECNPLQTGTPIGWM